MNQRESHVFKYEYIGSKNPITLDFSNYGAEINQIVLEEFYYQPSSGTIPSFMSLSVPGIEGSFNENMNMMPILLTMPANNNRFAYQASEDNGLNVDYNLGTSITLRFVDRSLGSGYSLDQLPDYKFTGNYLLGLTFVVSKL